MALKHPSLLDTAIERKFRPLVPDLLLDHRFTRTTIELCAFWQPWHVEAIGSGANPDQVVVLPVGLAFLPNGD